MLASWGKMAASIMPTTPKSASMLTCKSLWLSMSAKTPTTNKKSSRLWKPLQYTVGRLPDQLSADNGYWSGDNLQALEQSGVDAYIATDKGEKTHKIALDSSDRKLVKADFDYHETDNTFTCPEDRF